MKIVFAFDGTLIVVEHITTVTYEMDHEAYETASFTHFKGKKDIERAKGDPELESRLKEAMAETYPEGEPRMKDFYRTRVSLPDGSRHWVKASKDEVVRLLLDA